MPCKCAQTVGFEILVWKAEDDVLEPRLADLLNELFAQRFREIEVGDLGTERIANSAYLHRCFGAMTDRRTTSNSSSARRPAASPPGALPRTNRARYVSISSSAASAAASIRRSFRRNA